MLGAQFSTMICVSLPHLQTMQKTLVHHRGCIFTFTPHVCKPVLKAEHQLPGPRHNVFGNEPVRLSDMMAQPRNKQ